ncbi:alanyl-tRNA editing protein [Inquilinus sp. Marseille-Q2685]|uniref:alanyl-tRNA editing protein n=1 Tax=Inquilinus sp. Marseille-Q2685 TaxID=2866581 RepID=UPI001CE45FE0|nr:alanyl-tRNA editing protein [Inquilinus sp. Marseille-Q2685]
MARSFYHENPDHLTLETEVVDARPGRVLLARSPFYPGGGGQLPDRGTLRWQGGEVAVAGFEPAGGKVWHLLDDPTVEMAGPVEAAVDPDFRRMMRELHTGTHILNALVFRHFDGALVTGAQLGADGTARLDFDLPDADNDRLRALEPEINDLIRQDLAVRDDYVPLAEAHNTRGLIRSKSVTPPPTADGLIRIVDIAGLDRQACGGTHLASTGRSGPIRILKVDNKGRHNRRIRIGLAEAAS